MNKSVKQRKLGAKARGYLPSVSSIFGLIQIKEIAMSGQTKSLSQIIQQAIEILSKEIGIADTVIHTAFVHNYTEFAGAVQTERNVINVL